MESPGSRCYQISFLISALLLACRGPLSHCIFPWQWAVGFFLFWKELWSHHWTLPSRPQLNLSNSQRSHFQIQSHWELELQHFNFEKAPTFRLSQSWKCICLKKWLKNSLSWAKIKTQICRISWVNHEQDKIKNSFQDTSQTPKNQEQRKKC